MTSSGVQPHAAATRAPSYLLTRVLRPIKYHYFTRCRHGAISQNTLLTSLKFAQELLSTFSTAIGEVALQPSTGGTFTVTLTHLSEGAATTSTTILWDRKTEGGFPETKELKRRLRDVIEPNRDLGHIDRKHGKATLTSAPETAAMLEKNNDTVTHDKTGGSFAGNLPSTAEVVPHLKKHPANANKKDETGTEKSPFDDAARAAIAAAGANRGQQGKAEVSSAGHGHGSQPQVQAEDKKDVCEDCS